jgi:hypothetical protein
VKTLGSLGRGTPQRLPKDFLCFSNFFRSSRVEVLPVATEVLRTSPSRRPPRLLKATVRPVATCGPRCRVRRDSTVLRRLLRRPRRSVRPGVESGRRASRSAASPLLRSSSTGSALFPVFTTSYGLHDFPSPLSFPSLPRCSAWKELQWTS